MPNPLNDYPGYAQDNALGRQIYTNPIGTQFVGPVLTNPTPGVVDPIAVGDAMRRQAMQNALAINLGWGGGIRTSLQAVHPRTLKPLANEANLDQAGSHTYSINGPDGDRLGLIDTEWNPDTGNLHIADIQSEAGANSLGLGTIRDIRDQLIARYPGVQTLTGQRITGAVSAGRMSGSGPGRAASQTIAYREQ